MITITGNVANANSHRPIAGAIIRFTGVDSVSVISSGDGSFNVTLTPGKYEVSAKAPDFQAALQTIIVSSPAIAISIILS
ncbi:MAG TPA: carboxypeptidase regulatory-like domain-containing protein, partial [Nitrososphaera sp.]|nr:carboxypeptidase regulatory-like domain-containing protein [Nitrososphaera sp.]